MRFSTARIAATISGVLLGLAAGTAAFADDTEIFFNQSSASVPANIMFVLDTSGSMDDLVTTQLDYNPAITYTANTCASFDSNYYYYSTSGTPPCASANKIRSNLFKCVAMLPSLTASGYSTDAYTQWGAASTSTSTGKGTAGKPLVVTTTKTYGWQNAISSANTTGYIECKSDAGVSGDGVDLTKLYASTDTFSTVTVTTTPPGTVVISGALTAAGVLRRVRPRCGQCGHCLRVELIGWPSR